MGEWQVIALDGPEPVARAFVAGFLAGRGSDPSLVVFADKVDPDDATFAERIRDLVGRGTHQIALLPKSDGDALIAALAAGAYPPLQASERQLVGNGSFTFEAETPSPEAAGRIRAVILGDLPFGVTRVELREEGHVDHAEHGVKMRAQAHEFTYRAGGAFRGRLPEIAALRRRVAALDFTQVGPLILDPTNG